jgi:hypothetical protein
MSLPLRKCLFCDGVYASLDPKKGDGMSTVIYRDTERGQTNLMSVKIVSCNKCNNDHFINLIAMSILWPVTMHI